MTAPGALGRRRRRGGVFRVAQLFANGEAGGVYDPSDLTAEKVAWRRNLLTWSEDFTNAAWTKDACTITANAATAPDGTLTADKIVSNNATAQMGVGQSFTAVAGAHTASWYVKQAEAQFVQMLWSGGASTNFANVNLTTGAVTAGTYTSATVTNAGSGWYRITITSTLAAASAVAYLWLVNSGTAGRAAAYSGNGTNGVLVWGAQLEQSPTATAYQRITDFTSDFLAAFPTHTLFQDSAGTTPVTGLGQPVGRVLDTSGRGNHAIQATSASRPLLDARVNLLTFSEQFDNAAWIKISAVTVTANSTVAPDGTTTADTLNAAATTGATRSLRRSPAGLFASTAHQFSVYAKANTTNWIVLRSWDNPAGAAAWFNVNTGVVGTVQAGVTASISAVGNGWFRCVLNRTTGSTISYNEIDIQLADADNSDTATAGTSVFLWGADLRLATDVAYPYQRVAAETDYADVGVPRSFLFDGVDDSLYTASNMDLSGTDKVTVLAGVRKSSDVLLATLCEHRTISAQPYFIMYAPRVNGSANYSFRSRGSTAPGTADSLNTFPAPGTHVVTGQADTSVPLVSLRVNAVFQASDATVQGASNYGNSLFHIGRRFDNAVFYNGKLYQLIVRGAATDAGTLVQAERYVAQRTGITL